MDATSIYNPNNPFWLSETHKLPGRFFINNLNECTIFHNATVANYYHPHQKREIRQGIGTNITQIAEQLNPNHLTCARKLANLIDVNSRICIRERRTIAFEQRFVLNGIPSQNITIKGPIFDSTGYIIGYFGYTISQPHHKTETPNALSDILKSTEHALLKSKLNQNPIHNPHELTQLIDIAKEIEHNLN